MHTRLVPNSAPHASVRIFSALGWDRTPHPFRIIAHLRAFVYFLGGGRSILLSYGCRPYFTSLWQGDTQPQDTHVIYLFLLLLSMSELTCAGESFRKTEASLIFSIKAAVTFFFPFSYFPKSLLSMPIFSANCDCDIIRAVRNSLIVIYIFSFHAEQDFGNVISQPPMSTPVPVSHCFSEDILPDNPHYFVIVLLYHVYLSLRAIMKVPPMWTAPENTGIVILSRTL